MGKKLLFLMVLAILISAGYAQQASHSSAGTPLTDLTIGSATVPDNPLFVLGMTYNWTPITYKMADLNNDGIQDLVGLDAGLIYVMLGHSNGTFQPVDTSSVGSFVNGRITVADVSGDNIPDILVNDGTITYVLLGNGDGTFTATGTFAVGALSNGAIAVGDLNGDGKADVVSVLIHCPSNGFEGCISVLLGNGDGSLKPAQIYDAGGWNAAVVKLTDLNGDGKLDAVVTNNGNVESITGVLLGKGDGTFQAVVPYDSGGAGSEDFVITDMNADGKLDLVIDNRFSGSVSILLGKGDGTFLPAVAFNADHDVLGSIQVVDLNHDTRLDVVTIGTTFGRGGTTSIGVLLGNGDGTLSPVNFYPIGFSTTFSIADVNLDHKLDVVVRGGSIAILLGTGTGAFQPVVEYSIGSSSATQAETAFLNADAKPDVVLEGTFSRIETAINHRAGTYRPSTTTLSSSANPGGIYKTITYTAAVSNPAASTLTGVITFQDAGITIARVPVANNQATFTTSYNTLSSHAISVAYSGDAANNYSNASLIEEVRGASKTLLTTSGSPSFVGQLVTFTASVSSIYGAIPDGELVNFSDGTTLLGSAAVHGGTATFTTSALAAKTHIIKATYPGDQSFFASSKTVSQTVVKYPTTTTVSSSLNPSHAGNAVTFTAHVASAGPIAPSGKVQFFDGTTSIGATTVSAQIATLTKSTLALGTHSITAHYLGDNANAKSISLVVIQTVQ